MASIPFSFCGLVYWLLQVLRRRVSPVAPRAYEYGLFSKRTEAFGDQGKTSIS